MKNDEKNFRTKTDCHKIEENITLADPFPYLIDTSGKREEREGPFVKPFLTKSTF